MPLGSAHLTMGLVAWVATLAVQPAVSVSRSPPDHPAAPPHVQRDLSDFPTLLPLAGEENVTMADDRHYPSENILIHEFSHSCMEVVAWRLLRMMLTACQCGLGMVPVAPAHTRKTSGLALLASQAVADVVQIGMEEQQRQSVSAAYERARQSGVSSAVGQILHQHGPS